MPISEMLLAYIPQDRRRSLALGQELPRQAHGAVLCADLSGFTPLTEALVQKLGVRRGADELILHLNHFYESLIMPVETYGGSVVDFSGDAINCWFDADDGRRAVAAAQAMQLAMQTFTRLQLSTGEIISLGVKIVVVSGDVHRLQVGNPAVQIWDTLAGSIMDRLAALGNLAQAGELLLDEATVLQLNPIAQISEWRIHPETGQRAGVLSRFDISVEPSASVSQTFNFTEEQVRPWMLPAVFARLQGGQGEFLTELRPAVALFMRFDGLDYDRDEQAGDKLDIFIRQVQDILLKYEGALLQLTIGDKGSYLYAAFGAPVAHEDDVTRAVTAALLLRLLPASFPDIHAVRLGLSRGVMRTGAYGSVMRRTYGVLGDEVNLAARLMQKAAPGQVLVSESIWRGESHFNWQALPTLEVKGKRASITPAALLSRIETDAFAARASLSALPMIGRQDELARVEEKLALARSGHGQIVSIVAEAGMGKSRLLAEVLQRVSAEGLICYSGECQSYGTHTAYLVWHAIWRAFFGIAEAAPSEQIEMLEKALQGINPSFLPHLPLLGSALNLSISDNASTTAMDAKLRKILRESLLVDCLRARAVRPLILILEDVHWVDSLSVDLLKAIGHAIQALPVLILLAHRPAAEVEAVNFLPGFTSLEYATPISLNELTVAEIGQLLAIRLAHLGLGAEISPVLVERVAARTQGNPFYAEELLNYLHGRGLDPHQDSAWSQVDLPNSLHSLILSRIDQLSEHQQITIKAASIIGRLFRVAWLYGYYPAMGSSAQVSADLEVLNRQELIAQDTPEPQLAYLFKHVITQEAAYESLAYATRASLHEQFASYLEQIAGDDVQQFLDLLAYHYERSPNLLKKREYLGKAGAAAQKAFANETALSYMARWLALIPETDYAERFDILLKRVQVYYLVGKREAQYEDVMALKALAEALDDNGKRAWASLNHSSYAKLVSDFPGAIAASQDAVKWADLAGADKEKMHAYIIWGEVLLFQSNYVEARIRTEQALVLAEAAKLTYMVASGLNTLAGIDYYEGNYDDAEIHLEGALQRWREIGSKRNEPVVLNNLGELNLYRDLTRALDYYEQAVQSSRETGDRQFEGLGLSRLGQVIAEQRGDIVKASFYCEQATHILQEARDRQGEVFNLCGLSLIDLVQNNYLAARVHAQQRLQLSQKIGDRHNEAESLISLGIIACELGEHAPALEYHAQGLSIAREISVPDLMIQGWLASSVVYHHLGQHEMAQENAQQALSTAKTIKNKLAQMRALILEGNARKGLGDRDQAAASYQDALNFALTMGLQHYIQQAQTGLAEIALVNGNFAQAQILLDEILSYLETHRLSTVDEIFWMYLTCYRILDATSDPRARSTLAVAYTLLQQIAARIEDAALRSSFLQNVNSNREIIEAWEALPAA